MKINRQAMLSGAKISVMYPDALRYMRDGVILFFMLLLSGGVMAADLTFKANIVQKACSVTFLNASKTTISTLPLADVNSADMPATGVDPDGTQFYIRLSSCGLGRTSTQPQVTLTGNIADASDIHSLGNIEFKFRGKGTLGGDSQEYFVILGKAKSMKFTPITNDGSGVYGLWGTSNVIWTGSKGDTGQGQDIPLYASVACTTACTAASAGSLKASLQFQFAYK